MAQAKRLLVTGCWDAFGVCVCLVQLPLAYGLTVRPAVWADPVSYILKASFVALLVCGYGVAKIYFLLTPEVEHSVYYRAPDGGAGPVEELFAHKYRIALLSAGATLALAALALPIYFALYCKAYLARREDKYHMAAIDVLTDAYWRAAEARRGDTGNTLLQRCRVPIVHLGSAALGALVCPVLNPLIFCCQLFDIHISFLEAWNEAGYVAVSLLGIGLKSGS